MYHCPICGKDQNRQGNAFSDPSNVAAHIDGCHDDDHKGAAGEEMLEEIEATATDDSESEDIDPPSEDSSEQVDEPDAEPADISEEDQKGVDEEGEDEEEAEDAEDAITMTPDEFEDVVHTVESEARAEGYDEGVNDGYEVGKNDGKQEVEQEPNDDGTSETAQTDTDVSRPSTCPECGAGIIDGAALVTQVRELAKKDSDVQKFAKANAGIRPDYGCTKVRACGYYVEDGEAKRFKQPSETGGTLAKIGVFGLLAGAAAVLGLSSSSQNNTEGNGIPVAGDEF